MNDLFPRDIETDRLELTALTDDAADVRDLYEVCSRHEPDIDEVTRYLTWDPHESPGETLTFVRQATEQREQGEGATYVVRPKAGEQGAGDIAGLTGIDVDWDRRRATLGTWFRKPYWGRGYSGERAAAMFRVAFERLDLDVVGVTCHVDNEKSRRAIERYVEAHGGRREGTLRNGVVYPDGPVDVHQYSVTREEYETATA